MPMFSVLSMIIYYAKTDLLHYEDLNIKLKNSNKKP